ncbi:MAG TPA: redoxin domain-containing protein [Pyrinomonadaceae bacterium]|jgi:thiol-disulfide isomerase/thioredoxin
MRRSILLFVALLALASAAAVLPPDGAAQQRRSRSAAARKGSSAARATAESPEAKEAAKIGVKELDGAGLTRLLQRDQPRERPLLVNFWATWCEPCREEFPDLVKIADEHRESRDIDVITVSIDDVKDIKKGVPLFLLHMGATRIPAYLLNVDDPEKIIGLVDKEWRGELPATFIYGRRGDVSYRHTGAFKADDLRQAIKAAVGEGAPAAASESKN